MVSTDVNDDVLGGGGCSETRWWLFGVTTHKLHGLASCDGQIMAARL